MLSEHGKWKSTKERWLHINHQSDHHKKIRRCRIAAFTSETIVLLPLNEISNTFEGPVWIVRTRFLHSNVKSERNRSSSKRSLMIFRSVGNAGRERQMAFLNRKRKRISGGKLKMVSFWTAQYLGSRLNRSCGWCVLGANSKCTISNIFRTYKKRWMSWTGLFTNTETRSINLSKILTANSGATLSIEW